MDRSSDRAPRAVTERRCVATDESCWLPRPIQSHHSFMLAQVAISHTRRSRPGSEAASFDEWVASSSALDQPPAQFLSLPGRGCRPRRGSTPRSGLRSPAHSQQPNPIPLAVRNPLLLPALIPIRSPSAWATKPWRHESACSISPACCTFGVGGPWPDRPRCCFSAIAATWARAIRRLRRAASSSDWKRSSGCGFRDQPARKLGRSWTNTSPITFRRLTESWLGDPACRAARPCACGDGLVLAITPSPGPLPAWSAPSRPCFRRFTATMLDRRSDADAQLIGSATDRRRLRQQAEVAPVSPLSPRLTMVQPHPTLARLDRHGAVPGGPRPSNCWAGSNSNSTTAGPIVTGVNEATPKVSSHAFLPIRCATSWSDGQRSTAGSRYGGVQRSCTAGAASP